MSISTGGNEIVGGGAFGMGGFGGIAPIGLIGLNTFLGGYGGGYGAPGVAAVADGDCTRTLEQTIAVNAALNSGFNSINDHLTQNAMGVTAGFTALNNTFVNGYNSLSNNIQEAKYDNAIQMCNQTSTILAAIGSAKQDIIDQGTNFRIADLERQLSVAEQGGPQVRAGAFDPVNPCQTDSQISNINQVLVQLGNGLVGVQNALASLVK